MRSRPVFLRLLSGFLATVLLLPLSVWLAGRLFGCSWVRTDVLSPVPEGCIEINRKIYQSTNVVEYLSIRGSNIMRVSYRKVNGREVTRGGTVSRLHDQEFWNQVMTLSARVSADDSMFVRRENCVVVAVITEKSWLEFDRSSFCYNFLLAGISNVCSGVAWDGNNGVEGPQHMIE